MAMNNKGRDSQRSGDKGRSDRGLGSNLGNNKKSNVSENLNEDPENLRTRKPGSQSNSSNRGNSGRGGGK
jgi:hypothetical protein